jgi:hypothetical protein
VGGSIGLAVLATLSTERTNGLLADGESSASALNSGYHLAYLIGAMLVVVAIAVAATVLQSEEAAKAAVEPEPEQPCGEPVFGGEAA